MSALWQGFHRFKDDTTGRTVIQLTHGADHCYPLYYFIPSLTTDERYLVHHRSDGTNVQLHRLDLQTGASLQLTHAAHPATQWWPWCVSAGAGVLDHRSALDTHRNRVIYFDGNRARSVDLAGGNDHELFTLPADRLAISQNCVSPDGRWFVYVHHDRALYERIYGPPNAEGISPYAAQRHLSRDTRLCRFDLETGEQHCIVMLNAPIHHVQPCGDRHLLFSSRATERSILYTDYDGGWYTHLRTQTDAGGMTCHYCATSRGVTYESNLSDGTVVGGMVSPETRRYRECRLPAGSGYVHVAMDPSCRRLAFERLDRETGHHDLISLVDRRHGHDAEWLTVTGDWRSYSAKQKSHYHPRFVMGGRYLMITAGDPETHSNHIFLIDVQDLPGSAGMAPESSPETA